MAIDVTRTTTGARELTAALTTGATQVAVLMNAAVLKAATDLTALTQQNASGRPGPNAPTGDYRGSWTVQPESSGSGAAAYSSGTDRAQANRLEYGFTGTDSLGRHYDQAPLPHHGPAVDVISPVFEAAMEKVAELAVKWA